jgi:hypothetical protein
MRTRLNILLACLAVALPLALTAGAQAATSPSTPVHLSAAQVAHALAEVTDQALTVSSQSAQHLGQSFDAAALVRAQFVVCRRTPVRPTARAGGGQDAWAAAGAVETIFLPCRFAA